MNKLCKKLFILATAVAAGVMPLATSGCSYSYPTSRVKDEMKNGYEYRAQASQGGWVAATNDYYYFINGAPYGSASMEISSGNDEDSAPATDVVYDNEFGKIVKGALCRIKKSEVTTGKAEVVVPLVVSGENYSSGIFIYGDRVYYATPTTATNIDGQKESGYIDFKSSKLDGSDTMKDYYFRADNAETPFRFVQVNGVVYCLHVNGSNLYSYNTKTKKDTLLAANMTSYLFNENDASDPYVYYTASVALNIDQKNPVDQSYNQVYRVRADASAKQVENKNGMRTFEVTGYIDEYRDTFVANDKYTHRYTYNADLLEELAKEADNSDFKKGDFETYPYVNLGQLVLDGIGTSSTKDTFHQHGNQTPDAPGGYTFALISYSNEGLYYKKSNVDKIGASGEVAWTYYLDNSKLDANWAENNSIGADATVIGKADTYASSSSYFYKKDGKHYYLYANGNRLMRAEVVDGETTSVCVGVGVSVTSYLGVASGDGYEYVYYTSGSEAVSVHRAVYDSEGEYNADNYNTLLNDKNYQPAVVPQSGHITGWYDPEVIDGYVFYVDKVAVGSIAYSYPRVVNLNDENGKIKTNAEVAQMYKDWGASTDILSSISKVSLNASNVVYYMYITGDTALPGEKSDSDLYISGLYNRVIEDAKYDGYGEYNKFSKTEQDCIAAYVKGEVFKYNGNESIDFSAEGMKYKSYNDLFHMIGIVDEDNDTVKALEDAWTSAYLNGTVSVESMPNWAKVLIGLAIGVGSVGILCVLSIVGKFLIEKYLAKKAARKTDGKTRKKKVVVEMDVDETIDLYATEEAPAGEEVTDAEVEVVDSEPVEDQE